MFRYDDGNQRIEARRLEKRCRGKSKGRVRRDTRVRMEMWIEVRVTKRAKAMMEVERVLSMYLVEINE
jgi:hypothetical protein